MAATDFIVAIELGSSKITGIAGRKNDDGSIHVLACIKEDSSSFIRKGVIYNLDKTVQSLISIKKRIEKELNSSIAKVYVGISGQSLRTVKNTVVRHLDEDTIITRELVDAINDENIQIPLIDFDILDVAPQEYKVGINFQADPVGVLSNHIEGRFLNIIAKNTVKKNLQKCFEQAEIEVADYFIAPQTLADAILTDNEKRSGCALIDFGADTTTISVYKNNILRHLAVIPLGGNNITRDICSLKIEEEDAEQLKVKYGDALNEQEEEDKNQIYTLDDNRTVDNKTLNDIIEARADELIANAWYQIQQSGYDDKLLGGIVITGGGSNLQHLDESFQKKTKIDKVKIAKFIRQAVRSTNPNLISKDGTQNTILGLLCAGKENCCKVVEIKPKEEKFATSGKLFEEEESTWKKEAQKKTLEEEEKKKKKEEEKRRKEEERKGKPGWIKATIEKFTNDIFNDEENNK